MPAEQPGLPLRLKIEEPILACSIVPQLEGARENRSEFDVDEEIGSDEPRFVLRANDPLAPAAVRAWAERFLERKAGAGGLSLDEVRKYQQALAIADSMDAWRVRQS